MADLATGMVSTEDGLADEKVEDMTPEFHELDVDENQFTTYTMDQGKKDTYSEKPTWLENERPPRLSAVAGGGYVATGTTINVTVTTGQGKYFKKNDFFRNMRTDEGFWVTSVTGDVLATVRQIGGKNAAAGNAGDQILIVGSAFAQGADFPETSTMVRVLGFNYTEIFRNGWNFSRTRTKIKERGGSEPSKAQAEQMALQKSKIEYSGFWGARDQITDPATGEPVGFAGGADEFITTLRRDVNGPLTADYLDDFFKDAFIHGSTDQKVMYVNPLAMLQISKLNRSGMGSQWRPSNEKIHGVKVNGYISGAYGYEVPIFVKKDWAEFATASDQYGGWCFLLDHKYIRARPLTGSDTHLLPDQAPKGRDAVAGEFLTEMTWEFAQERTHGILFGITT